MQIRNYSSVQRLQNHCLVNLRTVRQRGCNLYIVAAHVVITRIVISMNGLKNIVTRSQAVARIADRTASQQTIQ